MSWPEAILDTLIRVLEKPDIGDRKHSLCRDIVELYLLFREGNLL